MNKNREMEKQSRQMLRRYLKWGAYSRFEPVRKIAWKLIEPRGQIFSPSESALRILVGGDVTFDLGVRFPTGGIYRSTKRYNRLLWNIKSKLLKTLSRLFLSPEYFSPRVFNTTFLELSLEKPAGRDQRLLGVNHSLSSFDIDYDDGTSKYAYPFNNIAPLLRAKDLVLVNLETPLSDHSRVQGNFISDPRYAEAMKEAGISVVNLANNHIFDAGDAGFSDTLDHLEAAGISYIGGGKNFAAARSGEQIEIKGLNIGFLGYTNYCNKGFVSLAAEYPGVLPLDPRLIVEDIRAARKQAGFVFVSLHWGSEDQPNVHPRQIEIAHLLIDAGADAVIGHHPHIPHGIEIYKGKPILYSLGNFIFGLSANHWSDNFLAEIVIDRGRIQGLIIHPVSGKGRDLFQPSVLSGARADALLRELQIKSVAFDTALAIQDHLGYIHIPALNQAEGSAALRPRTRT